MIMTFQIITGKLKLEPEELFNLAESRGTRGHSLKLIKPQVNKLVRQFSFPIRIVNDWNSLPEHVISAPTLNTFKNRLDKHWSNLKYKTRT